MARRKGLSYKKHYASRPKKKRSSGVAEPEGLSPVNPESLCNQQLLISSFTSSTGQPHNNKNHPDYLPNVFPAEEGCTSERPSHLSRNERILSDEHQPVTEKCVNHVKQEPQLTDFLGESTEQTYSPRTGVNQWLGMDDNGFQDDKDSIPAINVETTNSHTMDSSFATQRKFVEILCFDGQQYRYIYRGSNTVCSVKLELQGGMEIFVSMENIDKLEPADLKPSPDNLHNLIVPDVTNDGNPGVIIPSPKPEIPDVMVPSPEPMISQEIVPTLEPMILEAIVPSPEPTIPEGIVVSPEPKIPEVKEGDSPCHVSDAISDTQESISNDETMAGLEQCSVGLALSDPCHRKTIRKEIGTVYCNDLTPKDAEILEIRTDPFNMDSTGFLDDLTEIVNSAVTFHDSSSSTAIVSHLMLETGVSGFADLQFVTEDDFAALLFLKPIECRKILSKFKEFANDEFQVLQGCSSQAIASPSGSEVDNSDSFLSNQDSRWAKSFSIPWKRFPLDFMEACERNTMPSARSSRLMINILFKEICTCCTKPGRKNLKIVTSKLVQKYGILADRTDDGDVIGSGNFSLVKKLENRFDNYNRSTTNHVLTSFKNIPNGAISNTRQKRTIGDEYGCTQWQPTLPKGKTKTLEEKRMWLLREFEKVEKNHIEVQRFMNETYPLQRKLINGKAPVWLVIEHWPFLKCFHNFFLHFETLTGVKIDKILRELSVKGSKVIGFLTQFAREDKQKQSEKLRNRLMSLGEYAMSENARPFVLLPLVMAYFEEEEKRMVLICEKTDSLTEVNNKTDFPGHPCLVLLGHDENEQFLLFVEKNFLFSCKDYHKALVLLLCSYFVFNLKYPKEISNTLEFFQRSFMKINPPRGSKIRKVSREGETCQNKVLKIMNSLKTYIHENA